MKKTLFGLVVALLLAAPLQAAPIYRLGNTCPTNADMNAVTDPDYNRQYQVTDAVACVYDPTDPNIQGDQGDILAYLGLGWTGLLQEGPGAGDIDGFTYTGTTGGTFTIGAPLTGLFSQFAVGIKDGGDPKWAIFLLTAGDFSSIWDITGSGTLSHFTLYGRTGTPTQQCVTLPCGPPGDDPGTPVPDGGATIALMGASLGLLGVARRRLA